MKLKPTGNKIIVKVDEVKTTDEKTAGGIVIPSTAVGNKERTGLVVAAGRGIYQGGIFCPNEVECGFTVLFFQGIGAPIKVDGEEYLIMYDHEVVGIVEE